MEVPQIASILHVTDTTPLSDSKNSERENQPNRVTIIGAGLSGLTAAQTLQDQGFEVAVLEQGRTVGGRLASKHQGSAAFDHGAQFFTTRSETFTNQVNDWVQEGVVSEWCRGFNHDDGFARYMSTGGMSQLAKHLAEGLDIHVRSRVSATVPLEDRWSVMFESPELAPEETDAVILACPAPLGLDVLRAGGALLDPTAKKTAEGIGYHRVLACMVTVDDAPDLGPTGALQQPDDPTFSFIANNQVKGISTDLAITFHLSHQASEAFWSVKDKKMQTALADNLKSVLGSAKIKQFSVKRWNHAGPVQAIADRALLISTTPRPVLLCGDAFGGPKVEGAYLSGLAAAEKMASLLGTD